MFCECGTLVTLPMLVSQPVVCQRCKRSVQASHSQIFSLTKTFSQIEECPIEHVEGAKIKMKCPKCGADEMNYSTAQLRSADEGQTVFYSCEQCGYKETVNS